jgi:protein PhnA
MSVLSTELLERCGGLCELSRSSDQVVSYTIPPKNDDQVHHQIAICQKYLSQYENIETADISEWREMLSDAIWSPVTAMQVFSYRILKKWESEPWAQDMLNMLYLDEETLEWADNLQNEIVHLDAHGQKLSQGDTVTLIQDLDVRGAGFIAKRGTAVRRISLVRDNPDQIEGKVDGQLIVILTKYVKKS